MKNAIAAFLPLAALLFLPPPAKAQGRPSSWQIERYGDTREEYATPGIVVKAKTEDGFSFDFYCRVRRIPEVRLFFPLEHTEEKSYRLSQLKIDTWSPLEPDGGQDSALQHKATIYEQVSRVNWAHSPGVRGTEIVKGIEIVLYKQNEAVDAMHDIYYARSFTWTDPISGRSSSVYSVNAEAQAMIKTVLDDCSVSFTPTAVLPPPSHSLRSTYLDHPPSWRISWSRGSDKWGARYKGCCRKRGRVHVKHLLLREIRLRGSQLDRELFSPHGAT